MQDRISQTISDCHKKEIGKLDEIIKLQTIQIRQFKQLYLEIKEIKLFLKENISRGEKDG